jgi:rare lipoprotein A
MLNRMRTALSPIVLIALLAGVLVLAGCASTPHGSGSETGIASFYGPEFQSRKTANGERYDAALATAAHRTLPFGTKVRVTNTQNGKAVVVRINDRGPFAKGRIIDLSRSAFQTIAHVNDGVVPVRVQVLN